VKGQLFSGVFHEGILKLQICCTGSPVTWALGKGHSQQVVPNPEQLWVVMLY
jgi:hypothetical protein